MGNQGGNTCQDSPRPGLRDGLLLPPRSGTDSCPLETQGKQKYQSRAASVPRHASPRSRQAASLQSRGQWEQAGARQRGVQGPQLTAAQKGRASSVEPGSTPRRKLAARSSCVWVHHEPRAHNPQREGQGWCGARQQRAPLRGSWGSRARRSASWAAGVPWSLLRAAWGQPMRCPNTRAPRLPGAVTALCRWKAAC